MAEHLVVSEGTVKSHINHLLAKIDGDRAHAVACAAASSREARRGPCVESPPD
ncbi:hypothetical protein ACWDKQ_02260 [Saccharopolyspora sp. NPDC000995]